MVIPARASGWSSATTIRITLTLSPDSHGFGWMDPKPVEFRASRRAELHSTGNHLRGGAPRPDFHRPRELVRANLPSLGRQIVLTCGAPPRKACHYRSG